MRTLIIEDVRVNQRILHKILSKYGTCQIAQNGEEGFNAYIEALKKNEPYDIIFLDIMMPGIGGIELLQKIRSAGNAAKQVKVVMATSVADENSVVEALKLGCDGYLIKPYHVDKIEQLLTKFELIEN